MGYHKGDNIKKDTSRVRRDLKRFFFLVGVLGAWGSDYSHCVTRACDK